MAISQFIEAIIIVCSIITVMIPLFILVLIFAIPLCPKSQCIGYWKSFPYAVLKILGMIIGFACIAGTIAIYNMRTYFSDNFEKYRCKLWFMPLVPFIKGDITVTDNYMKCYGNACNSVMSDISAPLTEVNKGIMNATRALGESARLAIKHKSSIMEGVIKTSSAHHNISVATQSNARHILQKLGNGIAKISTSIIHPYNAMNTLIEVVSLSTFAPQIMLAGLILAGIIFIGITLSCFIMVLFFIGMAWIHSSFFWTLPLVARDFVMADNFYILFQMNLFISLVFNVFTSVMRFILFMAQVSFSAAKSKRDKALHAVRLQNYAKRKKQQAAQ